MYQQNQMNAQPAMGQHAHLQEKDWGNLVLSELKRIAREYMTAALEASHPAIRQTFAALGQKTLQDQAELYALLQQMNGYGNVKNASQQELAQELQQQAQKIEQLRGFVRQSVQQDAFNAGAYQQPAMQAPYAPQGYAQQPSAFQQPSSYAQQPSSGFAAGGGQSQPTSSATLSSGFQTPYATQGYFSGVSSSAAGNTQASSYTQQNPSYSASTEAADEQDFFTAQAAQDYSNNKFSASASGEPQSNSAKTTGYGVSINSGAVRSAATSGYSAGDASAATNAASSQQQGGHNASTKHFV